MRCIHELQGNWKTLLQSHFLQTLMDNVNWEKCLNTAYLKANITSIFKKDNQEGPWNQGGKVMEQLNKVKNKTVVRNSQTELIEEKFCLTKLITCYDEVAGLGDADRTMNIV